MLFLVPYSVDVPTTRRPWANWFLVGATALISVLVANGGIRLSTAQSMVLDGWGITGFLGHIFLHAGFGHLIGNMIFLWLFGNAICARVGNFFYLLLYLGLGVAAAVAHNLTLGGPAIGASGAVMGLVGLHLVLYPINEIRVFSIIFYRLYTFETSSAWMILYWVAWDILGIAMGWGGVAYTAHLGGLAAGIGSALLLMKVDFIQTTHLDRTILDILHRKGGRSSARHQLSDRIHSRKTVRPQSKPVPSAPHEPPTGTIRVQCDCGRRLKAPSKMYGEMRHCPGCQSLLQILPST